MTAEVPQHAAVLNGRAAKGVRIINWLSWKITLPLILIVGFWPIYYMKGVHHPYQRACAPGELLIFSALILIEVAQEAQSLRDTSVWFHIVRTSTILLGIAMIVPLAFIKLEAVQLEGSQAPGAAESLWAYSTFGCVVAAVAILCGFATFFITLSKEHDPAHFAQEEHPPGQHAGG